MYLLEFDWFRWECQDARTRTEMIGNKIYFYLTDARVAELVDALDLGSSSGDRVGVQVSPLAPFYPGIVFGLAAGAG